MGEGEGDEKERRRYPRLQSLYLVSYVAKEDDAQKSGVSMARTLNVSQVGIGVEVYEPIEVDTLMEMEIAVKENIFSVRGKVVHSQRKPDGHWVIGIAFDEAQEELIKALS
jgi:hypothetical protein